MTDVSDSAACVKHSQQWGVAGMNKFHAGNGQKDLSNEWKGEERSGKCKTLVRPMHMQQVHSHHLLSLNQQTYLDEYFS